LLVGVVQRLAPEVSGAGVAFDQRHFSMAERVLTQSVILFDYLRLMLIPQLSALGPFHDHYPLYGGWPPLAALAALVFWLGLALTAFVFGPRWPIPAFAALWFLAAHSLESSWVPLELYFEHRNYLPAVGVITGLVLLLGQFAGNKGRLVYGGLAVYAAVLAPLLFQVTSLWGNPRVAAEAWFNHSPSSSRAAQFLAYHHDMAGEPLLGAQVLDRAATFDPRRVGMQLRSVRLHCLGGERDSTIAYRHRILDRIPEAHFVHSRPHHDARGLEFILMSINDGSCTWLSLDDVNEMAATYLTNPHVRGRGEAKYNFLAVQALVARAKGDVEQEIELGTLALEQHMVLTSARNIGRKAADNERPDLIQRLLVSLEGSRPTHPIHRRQWQETVDELTEELRRIEREQVG